MGLAAGLALLRSGRLLTISVACGMLFVMTGGEKRRDPVKAPAVITRAECSRILLKDNPRSVKNFSTWGYFSLNDFLTSTLLSLSLLRRYSVPVFSLSIL